MFLKRFFAAAFLVSLSGSVCGAKQTFETFNHFQDLKDKRKNLFSFMPQGDEQYRALAFLFEDQIQNPSYFSLVSQEPIPSSTYVENFLIPNLKKTFKKTPWLSQDLNEAQINDVFKENIKNMCEFNDASRLHLKHLKSYLEKILQLSEDKENLKWIPFSIHKEPLLPKRFQAHEAYLTPLFGMNPLKNELIVEQFQHIFSKIPICLEVLEEEMYFFQDLQELSFKKKENSYQFIYDKNLGKRSFLLEYHRRKEAQNKPILNDSLQQELQQNKIQELQNKG